jgi:hypothetical protein
LETSIISSILMKLGFVALTACSLGLIWLAESTAGWFFCKSKTLLTDLADNLKRTGNCNGKWSNPIT